MHLHHEGSGSCWMLSFDNRAGVWHAKLLYVGLVMFHGNPCSDDVLT